MSRISLLVGTRKGAFVLESDEDREDWRVSGPNLKGWKVPTLHYDRAIGRLFAGVGHFVYGPTIQRSDDFGATWEQATATPSFADDGGRDLNQIWTVVGGGPAAPETLYAGVDEAALFASTDAGDTWTEVAGLQDHPTGDDWAPGKGGLCLHSICPDPGDPDRLWVGISAVGVFRTEDGGETWTLQNDGLEVVAPDDEFERIGSCVHRLVMDPTDPERLYQQNHRGVYRTSDAAETWKRVDEGLPSTVGFPMVTHPTEPTTLYTVPLESDEHRMAVDGRPAVYRTADAGDTWTRLDAGLPERAWVTVLRQAMTVDSCEVPGIYIGTTGGE